MFWWVCAHFSPRVHGWQTRNLTWSSAHPPTLRYDIMCILRCFSVHHSYKECLWVTIALLMSWSSWPVYAGFSAFSCYGIIGWLLEWPSSGWWACIWYYTNIPLFKITLMSPEYLHVSCKFHSARNRFNRVEICRWLLKLVTVVE